MDVRYYLGEKADISKAVITSSVDWAYINACYLVPQLNYDSHTREVRGENVKIGICAL